MHVHHMQQWFFRNQQHRLQCMYVVMCCGLVPDIGDPGNSNTIANCASFNTVGGTMCVCNTCNYGFSSSNSGVSCDG